MKIGLLVLIALLMAGGSVSTADEAQPPAWVQREAARDTTTPFVWMRFWTSPCTERRP